MGTTTKWSVAAGAAGLLFKLAFAGIAVALPLTGVWIASSLAAHHEGPLWVSLVAGALCFPLLPLGWDAWASWRRRRRSASRPRILTAFDRLLLRTLVINVAFVGALLALFPASVFEALSTRGDWMLRDSRAPWANETRTALFAAAEHLSWLHEATHDNAYEDLIDPSLTRSDDDDPAPQAGRTRRTVEPSAPAVSPRDLYRTDGWPFAPALHPLVASLPAEHETSIQSVARYIVANEADPIQRAKALHDYVADRVAYDVPALRSGNFPPQDAESVFSRRTAVCAGSAALLAALGDAAGMEIVVVVGDARNAEGMYDGTGGHAWNAIKLEERWYLADPTWDAGHVEGDTFTKEYESTYFLTPPEVFVSDHRPDDPKWQLLERPLSPGDFIRQPHLRPSLAMLDLALVEPLRARHSVRPGESLSLRFANPHAFRLSGSVRGLDEHRTGQSCTTDAERTGMRCTFPEAGRRAVVLFGPEGAYLGRIYVDVG